VTHLAPDGVLVFDFWHTDAVVRDPPTSRIREAMIDGRQMFRIARPTEDVPARRVDIEYEFRWDAVDGPVAERATHAMRHFTADELAAFLDDAGLLILSCESWMERRPLRQDDWYGVILAGRTPRLP
jgi:hypothetical protein